MLVNQPFAKLAAMKKIILFVFLFIATGLQAQDNKKIIGKWKVAAMFDDKMYFNFGKDSLYVKPGAAQQMTKAQADSVHRQLKEIMGEYLKEAYFEFKADMTYAENSGMQGERTGTYSIDEAAKTISLERTRKSKVTGVEQKFEEKIKYAFNGSRLVFLGEGDDDGPNIEFEKQ